jgi:hypothetical protein
MLIARITTSKGHNGTSDNRGLMGLRKSKEPRNLGEPRSGRRTELGERRKKRRRDKGESTVRKEGRKGIELELNGDQNERRATILETNQPTFTPKRRDELSTPAFLRKRPKLKPRARKTATGNKFTKARTRAKANRLNMELRTFAQKSKEVCPMRIKLLIWEQQGQKPPPGKSN